MVIIFAVIRLIMEACQLCYEQMSYIFDWANYFEISLYILSIIFVSVFQTTCMCPLEWQWQVGVMAVLLAWINLIGFCAKFPSIGIYVIIFGKVILTFLKVILLSILLVITFGITFYMTFSETQLQVSRYIQCATSLRAECNIVWHYKYRYVSLKLGNQYCRPTLSYHCVTEGTCTRISSCVVFALLLLWSRHSNAVLLL